VGDVVQTQPASAVATWTSTPPGLPGVRHEYLDAGGLRTHVALAGPQDAPPLLLVHGWPQNWWAWRNVIPLVADSYRVIVPDLRGHGWSDAPAGGYEKEQLASDLLALLDALKIERATWVGHDWGGWTGFLAALRQPGRLERMLALCIPHPWTRPHPRQLAMLGYQGPISLPVLGPRVAGPMLRAILRFGRGGARPDPQDVRLFSDHIPPRVSVAMYRTFLMREVLPIARGRYDGSVLDVPTTLLVGSEDLVSRGVTAGPVAGQPQLQIEVVGQVGHWLPEQRPQAIAEWLSRA
jgi:pimeloyl-ACP methyl ester carboxylesterase